ncbi:hypothetical protein PspLS_10336 [Pyricularia sp. CBS 133598]|nr:hypothetical protein PspLS_10336 [Pyricularia sp. CBS 133598]
MTITTSSTKTCAATISGSTVTTSNSSTTNARRERQKEGETGSRYDCIRALPALRGGPPENLENPIDEDDDHDNRQALSLRQARGRDAAVGS